MSNSIRYVLNQHINIFRRLVSLSMSHAKKHTTRTSLENLYVYIRDTVYLLVMTILRYLMTGTKKIEGINFIVYLVLGLIPWFFMNEVILGEISSIKMNKPIVPGITFPVTTWPTMEVKAIFIKRFLMFIFSIAILLVFEDISRFNILLFAYCFVSMYLLMCTYNLLSDAFGAVSKGYAQLCETITGVFMFFLPILWSFEYIDNTLIMTARKAGLFDFDLYQPRHHFAGGDICRGRPEVQDLTG